MQKSLGISALVIAIIAIFIPVLGPWLTILVGGLAAFAYGPGFALGVAAIVINLVNIFVLSPTIWLAMGANAHLASQGKSAMSVGTTLFVAQAIALGVLVYMNKKRKIDAAG